MGSENSLTKHELKKHVATIHCSNAMSLLQRKISNALLYHAYHELLQKEEHEISIKQLCKLISYSGNNHAAIKDALRGLISTVLEWNVVDDTTGTEDWTASSILACVSLQGPRCLYAYSPRMKQLLHSPRMFGKINLYIQSRFKSSYGLALYENCSRYRGLPHTKWFDMEVFRKLMGVLPGHYTVFRDFKRRVLDKAIEEINTYSDLLIELELARERRQVVKLRFALKDRAKKIRLGTTIAKESLEVSSVVSDTSACLINQFGLSPLQAEQVLQGYSYDFIQEKIAVVQSSKNYQAGKVQNLAAYFLSALKNDYQHAKTCDERRQSKLQEEKRTQVNLTQLKRLAEQAEKAYYDYREQAIDQAITALEPQAKEQFIQRFYQHAETSIKTILRLQRRKYTQATILSSPQVQGLLRQYACQVLQPLRDSLLSMDKFLASLPVKQRDAWYEYQLVEAHPSMQHLAEID